MYLLKIKGSAGIPDFVQIRDHHFTLVAYFKESDINRWLDKNSNLVNRSDLKKIVSEIPYGKVYRLLD